MYSIIIYPCILNSIYAYFKRFINIKILIFPISPRNVLKFLPGMLMISDSDPKGLNDSSNQSFFGCCLSRACWLSCSRPNSESWTSCKQERSSNIRGIFQFLTVSRWNHHIEFVLLGSTPLHSVDPVLLSKQWSFPWEFFQPRKLAKQLSSSVELRLSREQPSNSFKAGALSWELTSNKCNQAESQPHEALATILVGAGLID